MRRQNPLDRYVHSFQHRWETDRQFRAALSGVLALVMVIGLCSCVGVATAFTNVTLANFSALRSSGGANTQTLNTGSHAYTVPTSFPTATVPPWAPQVSPNASPIPNSKTPQPSPSPSPTDSPTPSGGGGGPTATPCTGNCGGGGGNDTLVSTGHSPSTWKAGQQASISFHASEGDVGLVFIINFPGSGSYIDGTPYTTDSKCDFTYTITVPAGVTAGTADIYVQAHYSDGVSTFHFYVPCAW